MTILPVKLFQCRHPPKVGDPPRKVAMVVQINLLAPFSRFVQCQDTPFVWP